MKSVLARTRLRAGNAWPFLALIALLVVGCSPAGGPSDLTDPFVGGTKGLALSFERGAPPPEIFDAGQMPFSVFVRVDNLGEADVGPRSIEGNTGDNSHAYVQIIGINPLNFGSPVTFKTFAQDDINAYSARRNFDGSIIAGTADVLTFEGFTYLPDLHGNSEATIQANICYDYVTFSNTRVCIKDNVMQNVQDSAICVLSGAKIVKNSGGPVQVTALSQNPLGRDRIQITFTLENKGTGQIYRRMGGIPGAQGYGTGDRLACDSGTHNMVNQDMVYVKVFLSDDITTSMIDCPVLSGGNQGFVRLYQGAAATLSCQIRTNPQANRVYTDTMHIYAYYAYSDFVMAPILIRDVSVGNPVPR
jgi:hypothetical protein